ncbi:hypothetical protein Poly30_37670 [Planctomycetes bacterium Poly30]|uniref:Uncharacterized protein n=1 Tax=Saltatorellus ferox TaxID=2528018 RepID=A0A518EVW0_9BACT|nr:hypothetical protein Poly30_37670 [Planctomycetes bacterium Poly30]
MARRKVTMLEAFQRSARESAERAAAERRRVIADREKEIRRAETAKAAHELGHRLSQRANDSMGSLLAGIRGHAVDAVVDDPSKVDGAGEGPAMPGESAAQAPATDIHRVPPLLLNPLAESLSDSTVDGEAVGDPVAGAVPRPPTRSGPALPAFDRATHGDLTQVATGPRAGTLPAGSPSEGAATAGEEADEALEEDPFGDASQEEVEQAIASLQDEVFELPMGARMFALLSAAVVAVVFMMGYTVGHQSRSAGSPASAAGAERGSRATSLSGLDGGPASAMVLQPPGQLSSETETSTEVGLAYGGRNGQSRSEMPSRDSQDSKGSGASSATPAFTMTPEDETFHSPAMRFSILAITYTRTQAHAQLAMETYDYLYEEGFPVIHPIEKDSRIYLLVGAARTQAELMQLRTEIRELRSARSGAQEFRSAMLVNIDSYR